MTGVGVNMNFPAAELNHHHHHHRRDELKEVRNGGGFDGHGLSEEDESRVHEDVKGSSRLHGPPHHHQAQGPVVQWERFLPLRSLNVLLVENDDSTRHVVSALLRNCSYEVTAVANGLEAWKVLIDPNKQIDLVLTELAMPYLSGIGLLSKITNHTARKNLPVIMMSSDDSMGIVFNCLSKGAVDFLVKPIRKNELKNLWQHVWRKCHSSSGSGSESGIRARDSTRSRSGKGSDEDDGVSIGLTDKDGSDNGSGTQSSWSKRAVEVDSSQTKPSWDNKLEAIAMGKDLEIGVPTSFGFTIKTRGKFRESSPKKKGVDGPVVGRLQLGRESGEPWLGAADPTAAATKTSNRTDHVARRTNGSVDANGKSAYHTTESPVLALSLKRSRDVQDPDANVLRHSDLSAFSRYNMTSNANQAPTGIVGSCSPLGISSDKQRHNSNGAPHHACGGGGGSHNDDMGSTTNNAFTNPKAAATAGGSPIPATPAALQPLVPCTIDDGDTVKTVLTHPPAAAPNVQVRHHHHHYHHYHHHVHNQQTADGSLRNAAAEGNAANYGSASGSNNRSNGGENGSSSATAAVAEAGKIGSGNGVAERFKTGDGGGSGSGSGVDQERLTLREAALYKFRQKRKERCFEKKVRYQSRKKLAEQRPRVRGQFVRQGLNEDADS